MAFRMDKLTVKSQEALQAAQSLAAERGHAELEPLHLLSALLEDRDGVARPILEKIGVNLPRLARQVQGELERKPQVSGGSQPQPNRQSMAVLEAAAKESAAMKDEFVSTEHLLLALDQARIEGQELLQLNAITRTRTCSKRCKRSAARLASPIRIPKGKFQALEKYGIDLVERARQGKLDPVIGRDQEIRRVIQVLSRRTKNNPVLIGEPGVGKTAIVEGLALRIVAGRRAGKPEEQAGHRARHGRARSPARNSAASSKSGSRPCSREVTRTPGNVILFIDELHTVVGAGAAEGGSRRGEPAQAGPGPRRAALHRRDDARRISQAHREGRRPRAPLPAGLRRRADRRRHDRHPPRPEAALRSPSQGREDQGLGAGRRGRAVAPLHHRPLPARQGDRPDGRSRQPAGDGAAKACRPRSTRCSAG